MELKNNKNFILTLWKRPWLGFAAVFGFAFYQRLQLPWLALPDADTWGYLAPALLELSGEGFRQTFGRSMAYPLFIWAILRSTGSFEAIAIAQHLLGWLSGFLWVWVFFLWASWLPAGLRREPWIGWVGVLGLALFLLNARMLIFEMLLRPESIFPFFALLQIALTLQFIDGRWRRGSKTAMIASGAAALLASIVCLSLKPSWGFAAMIPGSVLLLGCWPVAGNLRWRGAVGALGVGLLLVFAWQKVVPNNVGWIQDTASKGFLPMTLFTVHADLISKSMHTRAQRGELTPEEIVFLGQLDDRIEEGRRLRNGGYRVLGHDPDFLLYHSDTLRLLPGDAAHDVDHHIEYLWSSYWLALQQEPLGMIRKILKQVVHAHRNASVSVYSGRTNWATYFAAGATVLEMRNFPVLPKALAENYERHAAAIGQLAAKEPQRRQLAPRLPDWLMRGVMSLAIGFFTIMGMTVLIISPWIFRSPESRHWQPACLIFGMLVATSLGTILTVGAVHSFDIRRYMALLSLNHTLIFAAGMIIFLSFLRNFDLLRKSRNFLRAGK